METTPLKMTPALRKLIQMSHPDYRGRLYRLAYVRSVTLHDRDWSGGTHADYVILRDIGNGVEAAEPPDFNPMAPATEYAPTLPLPAGYVVVKRQFFCGRDRGITIFVNPDAAFPGLPAAERPALVAM